MARKLTYTGLLGPETVSFGDAGQFTKNVPQEIDDDTVAEQLLAKGCFTEELETPAPPAGKKAATDPKGEV